MKKPEPRFGFFFQAVIKVPLFVFIAIIFAGCISQGTTSNTVKMTSTEGNIPSKMDVVNTPSPTATQEVTATPEKQQDRVMAIIGGGGEGNYEEAKKFPVASRDPVYENQQYPWLFDKDGNKFTDGIVCDDGTSGYQGRVCAVFGLYAGSFKGQGDSHGRVIGLMDVRMGDSHDYVRFMFTNNIYQEGVHTELDSEKILGYGSLDDFYTKFREQEVSPTGKVSLKNARMFVSDNRITLGQLRAFVPISETGELTGMPVSLLIRITGVDTNDLSEKPSDIEMMLEGKAPPTQKDIDVLNGIFLPSKLIDVLRNSTSKN